jgi:hypothetical protein
LSLFLLLLLLLLLLLEGKYLMLDRSGLSLLRLKRDTTVVHDKTLVSMRLLLQLLGRRTLFRGSPASIIHNEALLSRWWL